MKHIVLSVFLLAILTSCEVFTIKAPPAKQFEAVDMTQRTPLGVVYLFKAELDSNNLNGALSVLASPEGEKYLAIDRYEKKYEVARIKRMISRRKITGLRADTVSADTFNFQLEFDWTRQIEFTASLISEKWYITNYKY